MKRPARLQSQLSESLHKRLNAYALAASAAGVSVLVSAQPAEAKIIYTSAHVRIPPSHSYAIDMNQDGVTDITLSNVYRGLGTTYLNYFWAKPSGQNAVLSSGGVAAVLRRGVVIGSQAPFPPGEQLMLKVAHFCSRTTQGGGSCFTTRAGLWGQKDAYLGLKFFISGKVHYGWLRLKVGWGRKEGLRIRPLLQGYAYETIPNKPIVTGKTHDEDNATLGRLAQGATAK